MQQQLDFLGNIIARAQMALTSGTKLGPYEIQSPLGTGGMGEVYRARDTRLDRTVAIKVLPAVFAENPERLRRFQQEARVLSGLNHPNLLVIYDVGSQDDLYFLVSELLEGESLRQRLSAGALPRRKAMDYAIQMANGLSTAHGNGIVHRDLKPENLFVTRDGRIKILDFGLAKQVSPSDGALTLTSGGTETGVVLGTVGYMSPEQVYGKPADPRSDIFAAGVILYEMLTGVRAFHRSSSVETMNAILKEEPPEVSSTQQNFPPAVERLVRRCLEKSPEERFQSARDLGFALQALSDLSTAETARTAKRETSFTRRIRLVWPIAAGVVIALAGALWPRPPAPPAAFIQITNDNTLKNTMGWPPPIMDAPLATDGNRLYFTTITHGAFAGITPAQVSINGGEIAIIRMPLPGGTQMMGISPDGSELLVNHFTGVELESQEWVLPTLGGSPRRIGDILAHDVAWSPDKRLLAVAIGDGLFILDNSNNKRKIFSRHGIVMWPRWSPDGRRLRFTVEDSSTFSSELWEVRADGTNEHRLLPGWNKPAIECCGEWTRDGRDYVFQTGRLGQFNVWSIHEGWFGPSKPVQLTSGPLSFSAPLPSVDGKWLYMLGTQHRTEVAQLNRASGLGTLITWLPSVKSLDYSRDGKWVTYVTDPDGILWRSRADGSDRLQLTYPPLMALSPSWSPDGTKVAFTAVRSGKPLQIEIIPSDGGTSQPVFAEARNQGSSSWSADGQTIFLGRLPWLETDTSLTTRIAKVDLRTHLLSEIPGSEDMFSPVLSPDGNHLAAKHGAASSQVALLDLARGKWNILTDTTDYRPAFSTDSNSLYFTSRNDELVVYSLATREIKRIRTHGFLAVSGATLESSWFLGTGPDGSPITVRDQRSTQIYAMRWKR